MTSGSSDTSLPFQPSSFGAYDVPNLTKAIQVPIADAEPETISIFTEGWMFESSSTKTVEPETSAERVVQDLTLQLEHTQEKTQDSHQDSPYEFIQALNLVSVHIEEPLSGDESTTLLLKTKMMMSTTVTK